MAKLPSDAFSYYVSLGDERSYEKVGAHFGADKRSVTKKAGKEHWAEQLAEMEAAAKKKARDQMQVSLDEQVLRHGKMVRAMAGRAVQGMHDYPLTNGMDAIRAAELVIKLERLLAGEPTEHTQETIAQVTREEMHRFLAPPLKEGEVPGENDW
jgi:hypothetical protein